MTHDPNMLKNKSRGNLVGKIKVSLPEGNTKIPAETVCTVPGCVQSGTVWTVSSKNFRISLLEETL